ncbi:MAG: hypothetical protein HQM08_11395 [Candidatus Riflebacteria bacterium]|nr:hypothetical protein [Candidatus Riflebacteria bacterium]
MAFLIWARLRLFLSALGHLPNLKIAFLVFFVTFVLPNSLLFSAEPFTLLFNGSLQGTLRNENGILMAKVSTIAAETRKKASDLLMVCNGNMLGPSNTSYSDNGAWIMDSLNACGIEAMVPGPHDLSIGQDEWWKRVSEAAFPIIWTNLSPNDTEAKKYHARTEIRRWAVFNKGSERIRIMGVMSPEVMTFWPNWPKTLNLEPLQGSLASASKEAGDADWTIVMGYLSFAEAQTLLEKFPWIDLVITNSNRPKDGLLENIFEQQFADGRRILWTRHQITSLGLIEGSKTATYRSLKTMPIPLSSDIPEDASLSMHLNEVERNYNAIKDVPVTNLSPMEMASYSETLVQALCYELHAELGAVPAAHLRGAPSSLELTEGDIRRTSPNSERIALLTIRGAIIRELWKKRDQPLLRGKGLVLSGLCEHRGQLLLNGRPIGDSIEYRIATTEYLALGGLSFFPPSPNHVRKESFFQMMVQHFSRKYKKGREESRKQLAEKPYLRHHTSLGFDFNRLNFGGSAPAYQNPEGGGFFMDRDVPGLVGTAYRTVDFSLNWKTVYSKVHEDWIFRGENSLYQRDGITVRDRSKMVLRWTRNSAIGTFNPFIEFSSLSPISQSSSAGKRPPLFLEGVIGLKKKISKELGIFAGVIEMVRQSWPSKPRNFGLQTQYDLELPLPHGFELNSNMSYFMTNDSDKIRMYEGSLEFKYKFAPKYALTLRENLFGWKEAAIPSFATRNEIFFGVTCELGFRKF